MEIDTDARHSDLFDRRWVRILLFVLVPSVVFILVCAGIRVSQYGIKHTIVVQGQKRMQAGGRASLRVSLIDDAKGYFLPERLTGFIVTEKGRRVSLFDGEVFASGYSVARNFEVPLIEKGDAELELHVYFDGKRRIVRAKLSIEGSLPKQQLVCPDDVKKNLFVAPSVVDDLEVALHTEGRGAPIGLDSLVFILITEKDGTPVSTDYRLKLPSFSKTASAKRVTGKTDASGLDAFSVKPLDLHYPVKLLAPSETEMGEGDSDGTGLFLATVFCPIKVDFISPLIHSGRPVEMKITRVSGGSPLYIDLFKDGQWVYSRTVRGRPGTTPVSLDLDLTGIVRVQVTENALGFSRNVAVRHIYLMDDTQTGEEALRDILRRLERGQAKRWSKNVDVSEKDGTEGQNMMAAFALSRLYRGHSPLPELVGSRKGDDAELNAFKERFQKGLMIAIVLLGVGVALLIAVIARQSAGRQARITAMIMDASADEEEDGKGEQRVTDMPVGDTRRFGNALQIGVLFIVVVSAFSAIALLVMTMSWGV